MIWQMVLQGVAYFATVVLLLLVLLPKLIESLTWEGDFPEYGRWFGRDYYEGSGNGESDGS